MVQLPLAIALSMPALIISVCSARAASKFPARLLLLSVLSACARKASPDQASSPEGEQHSPQLI